MKYAALFIFIFTLFITASYPTPAFAQETSAGIAVSIPIKDPNVKDGDIIASTPKGFGMTNLAYDSNIYGVITESPSMLLQNTSDSTLKPVTTSGKIFVLVSSINGNIVKNDLVTSSTIPGIGQKATRNGMILGTALQDYKNSDAKVFGKILVAVNPHFNASFNDSKTNILEVLRNASNPGTLTQLTSLRYVIAGIIVMLVFAISFIYFGRALRSGIEALGRNPLASRMIQVGLVINLVLMIAVVLGGLAIAYMILIL